MSYSDDVVEIPVAETRLCPSCGREIPSYRDFICWCECGWGIVPEQLAVERLGRVETLYVKLGLKAGRHVFEQLGSAKALRPTVTWERVLAYGLAILVYVAYLAVAGLGVVSFLASIASAIDSVFAVSCLAMAIAIICFGILWLARPQPLLLGSEDQLLPRVEYPALYALVDRISAKLSSAPLDGIVIDHLFGLFMARIGQRRRIVMWIGLPYLTVLDDQEKVAAIARMLAYAERGSHMLRGALNLAQDILLRWRDFAFGLGFPPGHPAEVLLAPVLLPIIVLRWVLRLWSAALAHLVWRDRQRESYVADDHCANIAGTHAAISSLRKFYLYPYFRQTLQRMALRGLDDADFFSLLHKQIAVLPEREHERIRRMSVLEGSTLDKLNPPTAWRIAMLRRHEHYKPQVTLTDDEASQLHQELQSLEKQIQARLFAWYRDGLHNG